MKNLKFPIDLKCNYSDLVNQGWEEDENIDETISLDVDFLGSEKEPSLCGTNSTNDRFVICSGYDSFGGKEEFENLVKKHGK